MPKESHNPKSQARGKSSGFIAVPRSFFQWNKGKDPYLCLILFYLVSKASTKRRSFTTTQGREIFLERLELATSARSISEKLGISEPKLRRVFSALKKLKLITITRITYHLSVIRLDKRFHSWVSLSSEQQDSPNGYNGSFGSDNGTLLKRQTQLSETSDAISRTSDAIPELIDAISGSSDAINSTYEDGSNEVLSPAEEWLPIDDAVFEKAIAKLPPHLQRHARQRKKINEVTRQGYGLDK